MIQCNIYGRNKEEQIGWHGGDKFVVEGFYDEKEMSIVSKVLHEMFKERKTLKQNNDPREMGLKVALNTAYGILRSQTFKNTFDEIVGNDVCLIGQQFTKLARKRFKNAGYKVIYTDTDSVYVEDLFNDKEKLLAQKEIIMKEIKDHLPFPVDTFDMDIDFEIEMIHFFYKDEKDTSKQDDEELDEFKQQYMLLSEFSDEDDVTNRDLGLMKKNYIFVYKDGDKKNVYIKNLGIVKRNNSKISKKIFWEKMVPEIIETSECKFSQTKIRKWIDEYLEQDISFISKRFSIKGLSEYKSESSIYAQIHNYIPKEKTFPLGPGTHHLIPNTKLGVGKGWPKYCTLEEYEKFLSVQALDFGTVTNELRYFTKEYVPRIFKPKKWIAFMKRSTQVDLFSIM